MCFPYRSGPFGTHTMSKTGYLLAFWRVGLRWKAVSLMTTRLANSQGTLPIIRLPRETTLNPIETAPSHFALNAVNSTQPQTLCPKQTPEQIR